MAAPPDAVALTALLAAQDNAREQAAGQARALVEQAVTGFTAWYDTQAVAEWSAQVTSTVQDVLRGLAYLMDAFMAEIIGALLGTHIRPTGPIDVTSLRRGITPAGAYGRVADSYRYQQSQLDQIARDLTGDPNPTVPDLQDPIGAALDRAEAVTDLNTQLVVRNQAQASMQAQADRGLITGWRRVPHPELSKGGTCGLCWAASDRIYHTGELMPIHHQCVTGDTVVAAEGVSAITRRDYAGPLVVLSTASGQQLRVTPNHPILTDQGWIPAGLVNVGTDVVRHRDGHGVVGRSPDEQQRPVTVEQVWRSATMGHGLRPRVMPLATEDFHGDGGNGEVHVVATDRLLPGVGDVSFAQPAGHLPLMSGHGLGVPFPGESDPLQALLRLMGSSGGSVGGLGELLALLAGHLGSSDELSLAGIAPRHSSFGQASLNRHPRNSQARGYREHGLAPGMSADDLFGGQILPDAPRFDPAFAEFTAKGAGAYGQLGRDLRDRLAGDVELDRIVEKSWVDGPHVVYNLHTREGWYSAGNLIVSNCHCLPMPVTAEHDIGSVINTEDLTRLYGDAGGTDVAALKRTRYQVTEHGELGPILNPPGKVRTARQAKADENRPPRRPNTPDQNVRNLRNLRDGLVPSLAKLDQLVAADPATWTPFRQTVTDRIADLESQLSQAA